MFLEYWGGINEEVDGFLSYFYREHIEKNNLWFEGAAIGLPSTNNCIESYNRHIKDEGTLRKQELVGYFLDNLFSFISCESEERNSNGVKAFINDVQISKAGWLDALKTHELMKISEYPDLGVVYLNRDSLLLVQPSTEYSNIVEYIN